MHETAAIEEFVDAMFEKGIKVDPTKIIADGKLHRIHVEGDNPTEQNGWYVLHSDDHPAGKFGCNRRYGYDTSFPWKSNAERTPMTAEERRAYREKMEAQRKQREEELAAQHKRAAELANRIWDEAVKCTDDSHPYLRRKGVKAHSLRIGTWYKFVNGERQKISDKALLVPIRDAEKNILSLQAILPDSNSSLGRDKDYLSGSDKHGRFYAFGQPQTVNGKEVVVIAEGYATGASVHEATGHAVIVAFDAPNLLPVAQAIRSRDRFKNATLVIAADNDQWTLKPVENPGLTRAREVVEAVGARIALPPFGTETGVEDASGKKRGPTDWNDWAMLHGNDSVKALFDEVLADTVEADPEQDVAPWAAASTQRVLEQAQSAASVQMEERAVDTIAEPPDDTLVENGHFTILGHDHGKYFFLKHKTGQVLTRTKSDFTDAGLIELAPLNWWEMHFQNGKEKGIDKRAATEFIVRTADDRDIYDPSRIRGRGAWIDDGRVVFHHGDVLTVDGKETPVAKIRSHNVYERSAALPEPHAAPLTNEQGRALLELMQEFRWNMPASALLFAGWIALAPVCGAIEWRPHVWLTGGAGCGKTTLAAIANRLLKGTAVFAQGNSTEAGIRQKLKADARPVLMDESESTEEGDVKRVQSILSLIRQASSESGAETLKGTADGSGMSFHIRSMFALASIQVALKNKADIDRLTVLTLRSASQSSVSDRQWAELKDRIHSLVVRDADVSRRLLRRAIDLIPKTLKNIEVFTEVAARKFSSQRDGDQYGTLLAGAWSLVSDEVATAAEAQELIDDYEWCEHRAGAEVDDSQAALEALLDANVTLDMSGGNSTISELLAIAAGRHVDDAEHIKDKDARRTLGRHGLKVGKIGEKNYVFLANSNAERDKLMAKTRFSVGLREILLRLNGAGPGTQIAKRKTEGFPTHKNSVGFYVVPLDVVLGEDDQF